MDLVPPLVVATVNVVAVHDMRHDELGLGLILTSLVFWNFLVVISVSQLSRFSSQFSICDKLLSSSGPDHVQIMSRSCPGHVQVMSRSCPVHLIPISISNLKVWTWS